MSRSRDRSCVVTQATIAGEYAHASNRRPCAGMARKALSDATSSVAPGRRWTQALRRSRRIYACRCQSWRSKRQMDAFDAVVVGAGCNGLAAAFHLLERGWSVAVIEQAPEPGGAVKT